MIFSVGSKKLINKFGIQHRRREVAQLVNKCRIRGDTHSDAETDERNGHLETAYIHPCQQSVEARKTDAEYRNAGYQIQAAANETSE